MSNRIGMNGLVEALRRHWPAIAFCVVPFALSLLVAGAARHRWQERAAGLERQNTRLEVEGLAAAVTAECDRLAAQARILASSDAALHALQDAGPAAIPSAEWGDLSDARLDSVVLVAALTPIVGNGGALTAGTPAPVTLRFSATWSDGRAHEKTPSVALQNYIGGALLAAPSPVGVAGNELVAAHAVASRLAPNTVLGWVVVTRELTPVLAQQLATTLHVVPLAGTPTTPSVRALDTLHPPPELAAAIAAHPGGFGVAVEVSTAIDAGYAVLRDAAGHARWILQVDGVNERLPPAAPIPAVVTGDDPARSAAAYAAWLVAALFAFVTCTAVWLGFKLRAKRQHRADAHYKAIIDQTNDGIVIVDAATTQVRYINPALLARLGFSDDEACELKLTDVFADGTGPAGSALARLRNADSQMAVNLQQRCKGGQLVDVEVRCNSLDVEGRAALAFVSHDVSVRRKAEAQLIDNQQRLDRMAHHDQLTDLPNRHYLAAFLPQAIEEAKAANMLLGVVFLDLDRFKHINDTRGHEVGDKLLQEVARRLRACVRDTDVVIRMGGDEFVVVFRQVRSFDEVTLGAGRIIATLNKPIVIDQHPLQTTGSVGVSLYPRDGADMGELLKHSDTAMYQAKDHGRNNVQMFNPGMNRKLKQRVAMEAALREALRMRQFDVFYQPFVNLATRKIVGLEALIRWRHPVHGMVPADQFIPVAEETGLIVPMGNFVLHRTLQNMSAWHKQGLSLVPVSLNVAPAQLQRGELLSTITTLLKTHGISADLLQLEMTERAVFDSSQAKSGETRQDTIAKLRDAGIKIAIDDFGTGYSSLSYLKNWRLDALKIDRSFVRDLVTDSSDLAIVSAIIAIARHLQIQVIAEGIEGYQQAEILRKLGCTVGQGFLFARPMPAEQCAKLLVEAAAGPDEEEDMLSLFATGRA